MFKAKRARLTRFFSSSFWRCTDHKVSATFGKFLQDATGCIAPPKLTLNLELQWFHKLSEVIVSGQTDAGIPSWTSQTDLIPFHDLFCSTKKVPGQPEKSYQPPKLPSSKSEHLSSFIHSTHTAQLSSGLALGLASTFVAPQNFRSSTTGRERSLRGACFGLRVGTFGESKAPVASVHPAEEDPERRVGGFAIQFWDPDCFWSTVFLPEITSSRLRAKATHGANWSPFGFSNLATEMYIP